MATWHMTLPSVTNDASKPAIPSDIESGVRALEDDKPTVPSQRIYPLGCDEANYEAATWPGDLVAPRVRCSACEAWRIAAENDRFRAEWLETVTFEVHRDNDILKEDIERLRTELATARKVNDLLVERIHELATENAAKKGSKR